ncbi:GntR family transcriptional regulator [Ktedonobacter racemifer DSM 44963]|uniref:GntR family transcriptional regulator n=1 Tax=Ktedonobacter racemifer DSM 44963 TaxID=485913 RepID=D6TSK2_KTERA|nr:GntR family transcriptional regulator [Ktedonobacter racemifer DSM 44963]
MAKSCFVPKLAYGHMERRDLTLFPCVSAQENEYPFLHAYRVGRDRRKSLFPLHASKQVYPEVKV